MNLVLVRRPIQRDVAIVCALFVLLAITAAAPFARAQVAASISGRVEDRSGGAIPAATVTVTNVETGSVRTVTTDAGGTFRALSLSVGGYQVKAEKSGFKAVVRTGIHLAVGQDAVLNLKLDVGEVVQEVTVSGEAPVVNTTTAPVSGLVNERQVKDLPLNGRSFDNLITLNPGTVNFTPNKSGPQNGTGEGNYFSVAGRRPLENLFLLNGIEYTGSSDVGITPGGVSGQLLGIDAVREFNVLSDTYSAAYGKRAGAQVTIITQSGTNQLHGSAFEFLRNSALDARNFFDYPVGMRIPPFRRNQFGAALGGPLKRDKFFLFGNYEGFRQRLGISDVSFVPDNNARLGLLPNAQGVPTPVTGLDRRILPYMAFWPASNGPSLGSGIAENFSNPKQSVREDFGTARADYTISNKDSLSGSVTVDDGENVYPLADPLFASFITLRSQVSSLQEIHIFSPQIINTARIGFSRGGFFYDSIPFGVTFPPSLSFLSGLGPGAVVIGGSTATSASSITVAGATNTPNIYNHRNLFTYEDQVQVIKGNHQISLGAWFQRIRSNANTASQKTGRAVFTNLTTFLQGTVSTFSAAPNPTALSWRSLEGAWFVEDSIRIRSRLTLRLGLRHEFTTGYNEDHGRAGVFVTDANGVLITQPHVGTAALFPNNATRLFNPRVGIAWDVFGNGKTAIRTGFGIYHTLLDDLDFHLNSEPPYNGLLSYLNQSIFNFLPVAVGTPLPPACSPTQLPPCTSYAPEGIQANAKTPTALEWNFAVEQELSPSMALRLSYVGSHSYHNFVNEDLNSILPQICANAAGCSAGGVLTAAQKGAPIVLVPPGTEYIPSGPNGAPATRPNPFMSNGFFWVSAGNASYNALSVELTRRLAHGLDFRANYTWSKNLDMGSGLTSSNATNQAQMVLDRTNINRDWGPSAMDIRHRFSGNLTYELPIGRGKAFLSGMSGAAEKLAGGWQVNTIITLQTGFPFQPQVGSNRSGNGDARIPDRPNVNPSFTAPIIVGTPSRWFDPNAFLLPTPGTFGNLGRNTLNGPGLAEVDLSVFKNTRLTERTNLQFRAEFFNLFNRPNFATPNPIVFSGTTISPTAGIITTTATTARQIQFGLKLVF